jgi:multiple sugar transport system ATP-binding protein
MDIITFREVTKQFPGGRAALSGINVAIPPGELLAVLGPSGSGKSTLLRLLAGLANPTTGTIHFGERDAAALAPRDRDAAIVFQNQSPYPHLNVMENLIFSAKAAGVDDRTARASAVAAASRLGLADRLSDRPATLSGGQKQRVSLGRVLVRKPSLILLDEPFSNLDPRLRADLVEDLRMLHQSLGATIVVVTHEPREAARIADRIAYLDGGRLVYVGPPDETDFARLFAAGAPRSAI